MRLRIRIGRNADMAICGWQRPRIGAEDAVITGRAKRGTEGHGAEMFHHHIGGHVFEHRHFNRLTNAGFFAAVKCKADHLRGNQPDRVIRDQHRHIAWFTGGGFETAGHTSGTLDHRVIGWPAGIRAA